MMVVMMMVMRMVMMMMMVIRVVTMSMMKILGTLRFNDATAERTSLKK